MAPPPPVTPTPHRFLVPRRSAARPRNETPRPLASANVDGQQFQTTPRFSLQSTPRASGSSSVNTPGHPPQSLFRSSYKSTEPIHELIESSQELADGVDADANLPDQDPSDSPAGVQFESDVDIVQESSPLQVPTEIEKYNHAPRNGNDGHDDPESPRGLRPRSPKRRRISLSISSEPESTVPSPSWDDFEPHTSQDADDDGDLLMRTETPPLDKAIFEEEEEGGGGEEDPDTDIAAYVQQPSAHHPDRHHQFQKPLLPQQQPTFQRAPKFKTTEISESRRLDPLPDAFSPHRRGAKYVPGGLAAEVRDWLVNVEAGSGTTTTTTTTTTTANKIHRDLEPGMAGGGGGGGESEWIARIRIQEARSAPGMTLVSGRLMHPRSSTTQSAAPAGTENRHQEGGDDIETENSTSSSPLSRVILAGDGRIAGLARRTVVRPGQVVGIARPSWEVSLQGQGRWTVACDWDVLSGTSG